MPKAKTAETKSEPRLYIYRLALIGIALVFVPLLYVSVRKGECRQEYRPDYTNVRISPASEELFLIEHVYTAEERTMGLSGRECIGPNQAMLFSFENLDTHGFWMKDMNFPIDIVWLNGDKKVVHIVSEVEPGSYPTIFKPSENARYVIELQSGRAEELGIQKGTALSW